MSMFGAVDLSSLAPKTGPAGAGGPGAATGAPAPARPAAAGAQASGGLPAPLIVDVDATTLRDVAEISTQVPVLVVLHSTRSQAATELVELLGRLVGEYSGRFQLARVDVDTAPEVAQALQAQAIPAVMALLAGQPVPIFQGSAAEEQVRSVLDQLLELAASNGITGTIAVEGQAAPGEPAEPEETEVERAAREAIEAGDFTAAEEVYTRAINQSPGDDTLKAARNQVRLLARLDGQDPTALLAAADAAPQDLDAALAGADAALALGDLDAALGRALEAVRSHTGEERETARLRVLELFDVIGADAPEVGRARRQLASILY
ncbi:tetratricopeptide repeat protein [Actinomyces slackii]|uniref:Thioredoxin n=1 Tax=Actinomyces slackii TaxID=52774 RepID=A0A3S4SKB9_9ACTO|nr:tetratricopeptide repeat protein [Actinomyces slackii]VEG74712.1 thioredoxin [Actinomyces slackii]